MANDDNAQFKDESSLGSFWSELYERTTIMPVKSSSGNQCALINMRNSSNDFLRKTEAFLADNSDRFNLLIRGVDYYIEVLNGAVFLDVYKASICD